MLNKIFVFSLIFLTISLCASEKQAELNRQLLQKGQGHLRTFIPQEDDEQPGESQERLLCGMLGDSRDEYNKGHIEVEDVNFGVIKVTDDATVGAVKGVLVKNNPYLGNNGNNWYTFDLYEKFPDFVCCCFSFMHIGERPVSDDRLIRSCDSRKFVVKQK